MAVGEALVVIGRLVQLFLDDNTSRILLLPLECDQWDTICLPITLGASTDTSENLQTQFFFNTTLLLKVFI
jgi:hypothetical protein